MMAFEVILFVLFWVAVVALAYWLVPGFRSGSNSRRDPIDIAKERYARGEISQEQLQQIRDDLGKAA